jgi:carboxyl-terminal processing protease
MDMISKAVTRMASIGMLAGAALLVGAPSPATATDYAPVSLDEWSKMVWLNAQAGETDLAFELIKRLPEEHVNPAVRSLRSAFDQRSEHLSEADAERQTKLDDARAEMEEHAGKGELVEALQSAIEAQSLTPESEREALTRDAGIRALVDKALAEARRFEREGDWLRAQELFLRLHLLFEEEGTYRKDIERISRRLTMMRLYTPRHLHDLRDAERKRLGEDPLPPYNALADDWREKLEGINRQMVARALLTAAKDHVDSARLSELLLGGLEAVRVMATTEDLRFAFPGLANRGDVQRFVEFVEESLDRVRRRGDRAGYYDLAQILDEMDKINRRTIDAPEIALLHEFGNGAMDRLDDYSEIIWPDELRRFNRSTQGSFTGVGIQISMDDANQITVVTPLEGTPAQRAGIRRGDIIREVDGESTLGITTRQAVDRITGEKGTQVTLTVEREGEEEWLDFRITRDVIPLYSVKGWRRAGAGEDEWDWFIDRDNGIGYLRLTQFTEQTTQEMRRAINQMSREGLEALLIDLRFNPGGLLSEAVSVANFFIDQGVIVRQEDANGFTRDRQMANRGAATLADIPVVVLVNEGSASASEIVAGALQDYNKAVVVGARTFGKGSVQNVYAMDRGVAALKLTTQYYRLPDGRLIHRRDGRSDWGVEPDVGVEMLPHQINEALLLRQDADILPLVDEKEWEEGERPDPERLLVEGIDPQLETGLLLLRTQTLPDQAKTAMLDAPLPRGVRDGS